MSDGPTAWQAVGGVGGLATVCGGAWGFLKWLFGRANAKERALDAKEADYVAKLEARLSALEERDEKREVEVTELREELHDTRAAVLVLAQEVAMNNPTSPALALARTLLRERFPLDPHTPHDMTATLNKLG